MSLLALEDLAALPADRPHRLATSSQHLAVAAVGTMGWRLSLEATARNPERRPLCVLRPPQGEWFPGALALPASPIVESAPAEAAARPFSTAPVALVALVALVVVEVEAAALEQPAALAETAGLDTWRSLSIDMKIVEVNREARTYKGPWEWSDYSVPSGDYLTLADATAQGFTLAPPPPPPVPVSVPKWAFLLVLRRMGKEDALKTAIAAYNGADAARVRAKWEASDVIERDGSTVNALGAAIGLTPEQVDQVFRDAEKEANQ